VPSVDDLRVAMNTLDACAPAFLLTVRGGHATVAPSQRKGFPMSAKLHARHAAIACLSVVLVARSAAAQAPTGAPPPDAKTLVEAPKGPGDAPKIETPIDATNITLSAGGQWSSGNSNMLAGTINGALDVRRGNNAFGAAILGNYGQSAPPGADAVENTENLQGRLRYDRYVSERASFFLIGTGRHDRFQGLDFRLNVDPGFKYIFFRDPGSSLWGEAGYDFQYDTRRDDARIQLDANGKPIAGAPLLDKTATDHSTRAYAGYRHAFNKEVTLTTGLEYLQSFIDSNRYRLNFDALFAAKVGGGLAVGLGLSVRYDHAPLPGKVMTDTSSVLTLIYSFSDLPTAAPPPTCPCPPPGPPTPETPPTPAPASASPPPAPPVANPPPPSTEVAPPPAKENTP
jgi:hypothetical protein